MSNVDDQPHSSDPHKGNSSNIPVPDPSTLTSEAVRDGITGLRDLMEARLGAVGKELETFRAGHEEKHVMVVDAAITHRKELSDSQLAILKAQVDAQFHATQTQLSNNTAEITLRAAASDLRYQQRYDAQTQALDAAFEASQKATDAALAAAKEAVQTALAAAEKAVAKAEMTTDKLIPRAEVESRLADFAHQIDVAGSVLDRRMGTLIESNKEISGLSDRLEKVTEATSGLDRVTDAKFVTFRTLIDSQADKVALALAASNKAVDAAFQSSAAAILKAEAFNEKRFDIITKQIDELRAYQASDSGRASIADPAVENRLAEAINEIRSLRDSRSATEGKASGLNTGWGYLIAGVGLIVVVVNVIIALASR